MNEEFHPTPDVDRLMERLELQLETFHSKTPEKIVEMFVDDLLNVRSARRDVIKLRIEMLMRLIPTLKLQDSCQLGRVTWFIILNRDATLAERKYALYAYLNLGYLQPTNARRD